MSSAHENTVFDFDLDFLNHPSTNNAEPDFQAKSTRLRKSIIFLKQRITKIDKLTVAAKTVKKENEDLFNSHMQLKQQCGQHLIEISYFIGKVTKLENEIQAAETREREKIETICELENKILALESVINQLKILDKERNKTESTPLKVEIKKGKAGVTTYAKKGLVEKELETLRKDNVKILNLEKENEKLRKEKARIPNFEKEIENLRKKNSLLSKSDSISHNEIARIQKLEKEIENLYKENAKIPILEKEIENIQKENIKIPKLKQEIENLQKDNAIITKLMKEIENLQKENAKIPKLVKEIEILRKENAKITKLANDETVLKQNIIISNLEKDIETLRIKNAKLKIDKALSRDIVKIPNKGKDIETRLTDLTSTTKEKGKLRPKIRKYKSLPNVIGEWTDNSQAENNVFEDPLLSPTRNDTITAKECPIADKDIAVTSDFENDNSNEVASVDTGRGSSLTTSDTDKGLHSPEYFLNCSPSNGENIEIKAKTKDATMTRRPILFEEIETPTIIIVEHNENQNACEANITSNRKRHSKLMSTVNQTNAAREVSHSVDTSDKISPKKRIQSVQEKECLEMNNRLQCESHTDLELENIFNTMKLNYNAVSPIPRTPMLVHEMDSTSSSSEANENFKRYSGLCCKTFDVMRIFMGLAASQGPDNNSSIMNKWDKLIESFEYISKSEHSKYMTDSNMELSDNIQNRRLSHDDNGLGSILNPESTTSSLEKETEIFQNKKSDNLLSQNVSLQNGNLNQLPRDDNNSVVTISNPSSPDNNTNILINKRVENQKQLLNHSVCKEIAMNSEISEVNDSVRCSRDIVEINQPLIKKSVGKKTKNKKITKLDKLKKKLKPKYKIKMDSENTRVKPKQLFPIKKKVSVNDTSATLNDKEAYEKAVKFMAEMKSQQGIKAKSPKHTKVLMSPTRTACLGKDINNSNGKQVLQECSITTRNKRKISELFENCTVVLVKDPSLLSPCKAKNSTTLKAEDDSNSTILKAEDDSNSTTHRPKEDTNSSTHRAKEDSNATTHRAEEDNNSTTHRAKHDNNSMTHKRKIDYNSTTHRVKEDNNSITHSAKEEKNCIIRRENENNNSATHRAKADNNSTTYRAKEDTNLSTHISKEDTNSSTHRAKEGNNATTHRIEEDTNSTSHRAKEDNNATTHRAEEDTNSSTHRAKEDNNATTHRIEEDTNSSTHRTKEDNNTTNHITKEDTNSSTHRAKEDNNSMTHKGEENNKSSDELPSRKRRRRSSNEPVVQSGRVLRSATIHTRLSTEDNIELLKSKGKSNRKSIIDPSTNDSGTQFNNENTLQCLQLDRHDNNVVSYGDLGVFSEDKQLDKKMSAPVIAKEDNNSTTHRAKEDSNTTIDRTKEDSNSLTHRAKENDNSMTLRGAECNESSDEPLRKRRRRSSNQPLIQYKRVLRSAPIHTRLSTEDNIELSKSKGESSSRKSIMGPITNESDTTFNKENTLQCLQLDRHDNNAVSYEDLDVFSEDVQLDKKISAPVREVNTDASACHPEESILCYMIQKHAREVARPYGKKIPDNKINKVCEKIERDITTISEANNCLNAMNNFVADLQKLNHELFIEGLIKYLVKPERKFELLGKVVISPFSAMTKAEHILLYAIQQLESHWPSIVDDVLHSIEFTLFKLNRTPEFDVVESTSHFYALLCKNYNALRRLKTFMLDAMYCIQFKSVPLIKQCLEVWKDLIPLPHMEVAKRPMVTCFIYLLHFYKCEDKLNRVQQLRNILRYRYHYQITNWNETKILEMFKNCIMGLKDISQEKKELRLALIILAKRNGPKWCQTHIIKNLLQPMIEKKNVSNYVKEFCVSMIGPLMKPYPVEMKVHCEIAIMQLLDILNNNPSPEMEEAAITSMMYINRHDQRSINKTLLSRKMKPMSLRLEESIRYYVKSKPLKIWKTILLNREYACNFFSVNQ